MIKRQKKRLVLCVSKYKRHDMSSKKHNNLNHKEAMVLNWLKLPKCVSQGLILYFLPSAQYDLEAVFFIHEGRRCKLSLRACSHCLHFMKEKAA